MEYFVLADFYKIKRFLLGELSAKVPKDDNQFLAIYLTTPIFPIT